MQNQGSILFIAQKTQLLLKPDLYFQVIFLYQVSDLLDVHGSTTHGLRLGVTASFLWSY